MRGVTVCQSKAFFDSEWEAILAANRVTDKFNEEMLPYYCNGHWHITHKDRQLRRGIGSKFEKCADCGTIVRRARMFKHKCERLND